MGGEQLQDLAPHSLPYRSPALLAHAQARHGCPRFRRPRGDQQIEAFAKADNGAHEDFAFAAVASSWTKRRSILSCRSATRTGDTDSNSRCRNRRSDADAGVAQRLNGMSVASKSSTSALSVIPLPTMRRKSGVMEDGQDGVGEFSIASCDGEN